MAEAPQEVLNLKIKTAPKRRTIAIDDEHFNLLDMREISLAAKAQAMRVSNDLVAFSKGELDAAGIQGLSSNLDDIIKLVVPTLPESYRSSLTDDDRIAIVLAFCAPRKQPALEGGVTAQPAGAS